MSKAKWKDTVKEQTTPQPAIGTFFFLFVLLPIMADTHGRTPLMSVIKRGPNWCFVLATKRSKKTIEKNVTDQNYLRDIFLSFFFYCFFAVFFFFFSLNVLLSRSRQTKPHTRPFHFLILSQLITTRLIVWKDLTLDPWNMKWSR